MAERPRVFVTRSLPGDGLSRLAAATRCRIWPGSAPPTPEALAREAGDCEGLLCLLTDRIDEALLAVAPRLRVISSCSVGVDHIDLEAATARGIPIGFTPGVLVETTADLAFALLLAAARRVVEGDRFVRGGQWTPDRRWEPDLLLGRDLHGATLGLVGLGTIGRAVARRASGFGMRILGWTRSGRAVDGVESAELDRVLAESDFVSVHLAYTPETRNLLDARALGLMKPGAILVNTARGGIVDESALAAALRSGALAAAGLDVFEREPLAPESPLLALDNVVLLPHIGSASITTRARMADLAVDNLLAGLAGRPLLHCANHPPP
ncbi:MAG: D-glycerate dehydrogenase [Proteobacteria bacterium]|nr:D-glycerate dehydrogenase [Pseudomonadota bacterium]MCZ6785354.1 D-glycerate dehydrogenase [Pseudomonadota bacterium]